MICIFDKDENLRSTLLQEEGFLHWAEAKIEEELNGQTSMDLSVPYFVNSPDHPGSGERNHPDVHWIEVENTLVVKMTDYNRDEEYFREFVIKETDCPSGSLGGFPVGAGDRGGSRFVTGSFLP